MIRHGRGLKATAADQSIALKEICDPLQLKAGLWVRD
jgi:hypothetical protein